MGHLAANSIHLERHIGPSPEENFLVSIGRSLPEEDVDIIDNLDIVKSKKICRYLPENDVGNPSLVRNLRHSDYLLTGDRHFNH